MARFSVIEIFKYADHGSLSSVLVAVLLSMCSLSAGTSYYHFFADYNLMEAFYMSVITFSTVGFHEIQPLDKAGQMFTSIFIITNIGIYAYALTAFSAFVIKGEIFKNMHQNYMEKKINKLKNHVILCGYGRYGEEIAHHFVLHKIPFVIIERDEKRIKKIRKNKVELLYIEDDATSDETLERAMVGKARAFITALPDDTDNVYTVLSARELNAEMNIISRAIDLRSEKKLIKAGANHVIMPEIIGGFYIATLVTKPGAVDFFSYVTNEHESDIGYEVLKYQNMPKEFRSKPISELNIRKNTGANIIGLRRMNGEYIVNPSPDMYLEEGGSFILFGSEKQLFALRKYISKFHI